MAGESTNLWYVIIDNQIVDPPEMEADEIDLSTDTGITLIDWLGTLMPDSLPTPLTKNAVLVALDSFKQSHGLTNTQPYLSKICWHTLQSELEKKNKLSAVDQFKVEFNTEDELTLTANLAAFGIHTANQTEIAAGSRLLEALLRQTDQYDKSIDGDVIQNYQKLIDFKFNYSASVWRAYSNHWQSFIGAPWLGITKSSGFWEKHDIFWYNKTLQSVLYRLAAIHFEKLTEEKSLDHALNNPLVLVHLANRLGGVVLNNNSFSQIGNQAALDLSGFSENSLQRLNDSLREADPVWHIRIRGTQTNLSNITFVDKPMHYPVLEIKPELQNLLLKPHRIYSHLRKDTDFFTRIPLQRFAQAVSDRAYVMSSDELALVFKTFKDLGVEKLMEFIGALRETRGLGEVLFRIHTEGNDILQDILQLHYEGLGFDVQEIKNKVVEWEAYLVRFFIIESSLKGGNDLLQAAWELLKEEAVKQVKQKLQPQAT